MEEDLFIYFLLIFASKGTDFRPQEKTLYWASVRRHEARLSSHESIENLWSTLEAYAIIIIKRELLQYFFVVEGELYSKFPNLLNASLKKLV